MSRRIVPSLLDTSTSDVLDFNVIKPSDCIDTSCDDPNDRSRVECIFALDSDVNDVDPDEVMEIISSADCARDDDPDVICTDPPLGLSVPRIKSDATSLSVVPDNNVILCLEDTVVVSWDDMEVCCCDCNDILDPEDTDAVSCDVMYTLPWDAP